MIRLIAASLYVLTLCGAVAQTISNDQFKLSYTRNGIASLKHVNDAYDTDYISAGRTLGDVFIRYRNPGGSVWQQTVGAYNPENTSTNLSYRVGHTVATLATSATRESSAPRWGINALNDQLEPRNSADNEIPSYVWPDKRGTEEWVQYTFHEPQQVSSAEVYWLQRTGEDPIKPPVSWRIQYRDGEQWKDVVPSGPYQVDPDRFNHVDFVSVTTTAVRLSAKLAADTSAGIFEWRLNTSEGKHADAISDILPTETFQIQGDELVWTINVQNPTDHEIEIGDVGIPLPFNTQYVWDKTETYTKRLIRHSFIGGGGSFLFWMRTNAEGPYLVMMPEKETQFEYFDQEDDGIFTAFVHSSASRADLEATGGKWRLPVTKRVLAAKGRLGDSEKYTLKFRWAKDYDGVRDVLYEDGGFDVNVVPGMTVPTDLSAKFSLRTLNKIHSIAPEYPSQTSLKSLGEHGKDVHVYEVKFSRLGENMLKVNYGHGQYLTLEFFVTEPLETLIKKRAVFLATREQWNDSKRWYNGLYSQWDMKHQVLRSPDDLDGLQSYAVACDDPALGKAPYLASKNVFFPEQKQIESIENYIRHYVWGGLQQTDKEPYPYSIYGIANWKVNRESEFDNERGKKHIWRIYDYPHVILLYYQMYLVAKNYPEMVHYLNQDEYLDRAYHTAIAFFTVPMEIVKWSAYETGTYNELVIPDLIHALEENGKQALADRLRAHWEMKAKHFIDDHPYLFGSEYPFDSTGFESTHALAKYALGRMHEPTANEFQRTVKMEDVNYFLEQQMKLNLACRGTLLPAYYWLGSDYRGAGNATYMLSYMAQMGGWAIEDYAVNYANDPIQYLRLGYASYLSSWALLNSGTAESNYGYWFPGKDNDGGAGGGFEPRPWGRAWLGNKEMGRGSWWYSGEIDLGFNGALRTAATVVSDDPIFGLFAYGGDLKRDGGVISVVPKDGLRTRFYVVRGATRLQLELDRDGFAKDRAIRFDDSMKRISFALENRSRNKHQTVLQLRGLPAGTYHVSAGRKSLPEFSVKNGESKTFAIPVATEGNDVVITHH